MRLYLESTVVVADAPKFVEAFGSLLARDGSWASHEVEVEAPRLVRVRTLWPYQTATESVTASFAAFARIHEAKVAEVRAWAREFEAGGWPPLASIAREYIPRSESFRAWLSA